MTEWLLLKSFGKECMDIMNNLSWRVLVFHTAQWPLLKSFCKECMEFWLFLLMSEFSRRILVKCECILFHTNEWHCVKSLCFIPTLDILWRFFNEEWMHSEFVLKGAGVHSWMQLALDVYDGSSLSSDICNKHIFSQALTWYIIPFFLQM